MLVALGDKLKQKLGPCFAERHEAQLIDDQQLVADYLLLKPQKSAWFCQKKLALADQRVWVALVLSRICAAPSARLGPLAFECQGAFASQC